MIKRTWPHCSHISVAMMQAELEDLWHDGYIPSHHYLEAAIRLWEVLSRGGPSNRVELRQAFRLLPSDGLFAAHDFAVGELILMRTGLARYVGGNVEIRPDTPGPPTPEQLLASFLRQVTPPWLTTVTHGMAVMDHLMPEGAQRAVASTIRDPERRELFLLALRTSLDEKDDKEVGLKGELAVVNACKEALAHAGRSDLVSMVRHVSLESDLLGYDVVSPSTDGTVRRLEVKTTRAGGPEVSFFFSRGQAMAASRDPSWRLVICKVRHDETSVWGWLPGAELLSLLPLDKEPHGIWLKSRIRILRTALRPGLPVVAARTRPQGGEGR